MEEIVTLLIIFIMISLVSVLVAFQCMIWSELQKKEREEEFDFWNVVAFSSNFFFLLIGSIVIFYAIFQLILY